MIGGRELGRPIVAMAVLAAAVAGITIAQSAPVRADGMWSSLRQVVGVETAARRPALAELEAFIKSQPANPAAAVGLAAHAGAEGHWTFLNRRGETFTVGTSDEMKRVVATLAPDADPKALLLVHLSDATVFERVAMLKELPAGAKIGLVAGGVSYPLIRVREGGKETLRAAVRSRLQIEIGDRDAFDEALRQLARPLEPRFVRVLSLEPGGPETLVRTPAPDPRSGRPPLAAIDPYKLSAALSALRGQTAVMSGRMTGDYLAFKPPSGDEATILAGDVLSAAARSNVDLVVVQSVTPHQPGGRNWLWQRFAIDGLDKALEHATFADFLETLAGGRGEIAVALTTAGRERLVMRIDAPTSAFGSGIGGVLQEVTAGITGTISPTTLVAHLTTTAHRRELSLRLVPLVPSSWQAIYGGCLLLGILGIVTARRWWSRLWPAEQRADYGGTGGYMAAHTLRIVAFAAIFLPIAGPAAVVATVLGLIGGLAGRRSSEAVDVGTPTGS